MQQTLLQLLLVVMVQSLTYINEVGIGKFCTLEYSALQVESILSKKSKIRK